MGSDFDEYEREYLERHAKGIKPESGTFTENVARIHRKRVESAKRAAAKAALDAWDYAVLEMLRRGDMRIAMKVGTVRSTESFLRLFCHGLIAKLDRAPTFDELERAQAFLDSAEHKQYVARLNRLMTKEVRERLEIVAEITGVCDEKDMWDMTDDGRLALQAKRSEVVALYDQMSRQYRENRAEFYASAESYAWALPIMVAMGFGGGMMMGYMHSMSDVPCDMLCDAGQAGADVMGYGDIGGDVGFDMGFGF